MLRRMGYAMIQELKFFCYMDYISWTVETDKFKNNLLRTTILDDGTMKKQRDEIYGLDYSSTAYAQQYHFNAKQRAKEYERIS